MGKISIKQNNTTHRKDSNRRLELFEKVISVYFKGKKFTQDELISKMSPDMSHWYRNSRTEQGQRLNSSLNSLKSSGYIDRIEGTKYETVWGYQFVESTQESDDLVFDISQDVSEEELIKPKKIELVQTKLRIVKRVNTKAKEVSTKVPLRSTKLNEPEIGKSKKMVLAKIPKISERKTPPTSQESVDYVPEPIKETPTLVKKRPQVVRPTLATIKEKPVEFPPVLPLKSRILHFQKEILDNSECFKNFPRFCSICFYPLTDPIVRCNNEVCWKGFHLRCVPNGSEKNFVCKSHCCAIDKCTTRKRDLVHCNLCTRAYCEQHRSEHMESGGIWCETCEKYHQ